MSSGARTHSVRSCVRKPVRMSKIGKTRTCISTRTGKKTSATLFPATHGDQRVDDVERRRHNYRNELLAIAGRGRSKVASESVTKGASRGVTLPLPLLLFYHAQWLNRRAQDRGHSHGFSFSHYKKPLHGCPSSESVMKLRR